MPRGDDSRADPAGPEGGEGSATQEVRRARGPALCARDDAVRASCAGGSKPGRSISPIRSCRSRFRACGIGAGHEVPLATYEHFQTPRALDVGLFRRVLGGLSCREYEAAAEAVPAAFGLAKTSVSRRFIRASARALRQLTERRLDDAEWLVLVLDGKTFARDAIVMALGVTRDRREAAAGARPNRVGE